MGVETIQSSDRQYLQLYKQISTAWKPFIIVDESIKIKNYEAKRTRRLHELGKMVEYKLILNGEPIVKDLLDILPQMDFLSPKILNMGVAEFKNTFCNYTKITRHTANWGRSYTKEFITGYENIDYLYSLIGEYVFECDLDLNLERYFTEMHYRIDDEAKAEYYRLKTKYLDNEMLLMKNNNIFLELTMKMQHEYCCTEEKFDLVKEWFKAYPEEKAIIFTKYIASTEECKKRFPKSTVLNYKTGVFSYNLQHLPYMVMFDKTFDWGDRRQGLARNFRTGSEGDYRVLDLTGDVGLEDLMKKNNQKKLSTSEYLKTISKKALEEQL
jgi:SNF2 family DNA or RNA helicase